MKCKVVQQFFKMRWLSIVIFVMDKRLYFMVAYQVTVLCTIYPLVG
jgi:hypothetical protein